MRVFRPLITRNTVTAVGGTCHTSRATFYDKIKDERDRSENDVEAMFAEFPRNPNAQKVPEELHQVSRKVIDRAERLNYIFLGCFVVGLALVSYYIDPFRDDVSARPDKSLAAQVADKYGTQATR